MMRPYSLFLMGLLCCACQSELQQGGAFSIDSTIPGLRKGVEIGLLSEEGERHKIATAIVEADGVFHLADTIDHPTLCMLTTNNLQMIADEVEAGNYEHVRWTYTPVFVSASEMKIAVADYDQWGNEPVSPTFRITGGQPQEDFNAWNEMQPQDKWLFIGQHPESVVSLWLANDMLEDGYNLTAEEMEQLGQTITGCPADTARYATFCQRLAMAKQTPKGSPLVDLPLLDPDGNAHNLNNILPTGKLVLVDFWASWCGICRAANPGIKELLSEFPDRFTVISISSDKDDAAWRRAMEQEACPWPQYVLTREGYDRFFHDYQTMAVPYFLLVDAEGHVLCNPKGIEDIQERVRSLLSKD